MAERESCKHFVFMRVHGSDLMTNGNNADEIIGDFVVKNSLFL